MSWNNVINLQSEIPLHSRYNLTIYYNNLITRFLYGQTVNYYPNLAIIFSTYLASKVGFEIQLSPHMGFSYLLRRYATYKYILNKRLLKNTPQNIYQQVCKPMFYEYYALWGLGAFNKRSFKRIKSPSIDY